MAGKFLRSSFLSLHLDEPLLLVADYASNRTRMAPEGHSPSYVLECLHSVRHKRVPCAPELRHILGRSQRDPNVILKTRVSTRHKDALLPELLGNLSPEARGFQHHEVGHRIERAQHPGIGLVVEFLAIVRNTLDDLLHRSESV